MQRWTLRCLATAIVALCACKGKDAVQGKDNLPATAPTATDLDTRCDVLGKTCGDTDKHVTKIVEQCRQVAKQQVAKGCTDQASALSDCYSKELCGKADKVWSFDDLAVLAQRTSKCAAPRAALDACVAK